MLNRVDFKGCCEKTELQERVKRLWNHHVSAPCKLHSQFLKKIDSYIFIFAAAEILPSEELCKICMDKPIECVLLECGHLATCLSCGKVLSECPICRQFIIRVVRFFKS